jgi:hypothetical protein
MLADHPRGVQPLQRRGRWVVVDSHPICAACGTTVIPTGLDQWRHLSPGRTYTGRSRWLPPMPLQKLAALRGYGAAVAAYPWLPNVASEPEWADAHDRANDYVAGLGAARRRRRLNAGENPCLDLHRKLTASPVAPGVTALLDLPQRRRELASLFSWAIPTADALSMVAGWAPIVDAGAGMGYWTALLRTLGVDVAASDLAPPGDGGSNDYHRDRRQPWTAVQHAGSVTAVRQRPGHTLLLCWPPYDDDAASYEVLRAYRGEVLLYAGGKTAGSVRFHRELDLNWRAVEQVPLPRWPWLSDHLVAYRRNPARRAHRTRDRCPDCGRFIPTGSIGRCDTCFEHRPPALALRSGRHRLEYPQEVLDQLPVAVRRAFEQSPNRLTTLRRHSPPL